MDTGNRVAGEPPWLASLCGAMPGRTNHDQSGWLKHDVQSGSFCLGRARLLDYNIPHVD